MCRKLKKYLFIFLFCGMISVGCESGGNDNFPGKIPELPEVAIHFSMDRVTTKGETVLGTEAPAGSLGVLGYFLVDGTWNSTTATPNFMYNTQLIRTGSAGAYSYIYYPAKYWPDNTNSKIRFFAYYPYNGKGIALSSFSATGYPTITYTPDSNVTGQVDLLYASTDDVNNKLSGSVVNFVLAHALTRIGFSVKLSSSYTNETVLVQSIQITGLKRDGALSLDPSLSNPWTWGSATASYTASVSGGSLIPIANQALNTDGYLSVTTPYGYMMLLPQGVTTDNKIIVTYTINGTVYTVTYSLSALTWGQGQSLNYQLTIPFQ